MIQDSKQEDSEPQPYEALGPAEAETLQRQPAPNNSLQFIATHCNEEIRELSDWALDLAISRAQSVLDAVENNYTKGKSSEATYEKGKRTWSRKLEALQALKQPAVEFADG